MPVAVHETFFDERLTVAVPLDFRDAVRAAADRAGLTVADYARLALSERMDRDGVSHPCIPTLSGPLPNRNGAFSGAAFCTVATMQTLSDKVGA